MRYQIQTAAIQGSFADTLKKVLGPLEMPFYEDSELLFWPNHFTDDNRGWVTYVNGKTKGGTLRYKAAHIRIPVATRLPVFESSERNSGANRAIVEIARIVICPAKQLNLEELAADGFKDHDEMLREMHEYYPDMLSDSLVSFYWFGATHWAPKP